LRRSSAKGEQWIRNDGLLAVATHAHTHQHVETLDDLRPHLADEIEAFFQHYNAMKGSDFKPVNRGGPKKARKLLDRPTRYFKRSSRRETTVSSGTPVPCQQSTRG
jgi:inorganic pyrophosphatase